MLYVFSTNRVKLVARKPKTTNNMGQREYVHVVVYTLENDNVGTRDIAHCVLLASSWNWNRDGSLIKKKFYGFQTKDTQIFS